MNKKTKMFVGILIVVVALSAQIYTCRHKQNKDKDIIMLINTLNDSLKIERDENGNLHATINSITTSTTGLFTELDLKDTELKSLQENVKKYKNQLKRPGSGLITMISEWSIKGVSPIQSISDSKDTMLKYPTLSTDSSLKFNWKPVFYPKYDYAIVKNDWLTYLISATKDSATLNLKIKNKYSIVLSYDDKGVPYADVTNENPYDSVKTLRSYQVSLPLKPTPKRWGIGLSTGAAIGNNLKPTPYIGFGINYNLIRF